MESSGSSKVPPEGGVETIDSDREQPHVMTVVMAALACAATVLVVWFAMPWLQSNVLPAARGGITGPWVMKASKLTRLASIAGVSMVLIPVVVEIVAVLVRRRSERRGIAVTRPADAELRRFARIMLFVSGLGISAFFVPQYFGEYTLVDERGITHVTFQASTTRQFDEIVELQSTGLRRGGQRPNTRIKFDSGPPLMLSDLTKEMARDESTHMSEYIRDRSGVSWTQW